MLQAIYESGVSQRQQFAQRGDAQWFTRVQKMGSFGYCWSKWLKCSDKIEQAGLNTYAGKARLPKN